MSEHVLTGEVVAEQPAELMAVVKREGVAGETGAVLLSSFAPFRAQIQAARETAAGVTPGIRAACPRV